MSNRQLPILTLKQRCLDIDTFQNSSSIDNSNAPRDSNIKIFGRRPGKRFFVRSIASIPYYCDVRKDVGFTS